MSEPTTPPPSPLARFGRPKVFLPVIHVTSVRRAIENADIAADAGADGVFLIHHSGTWRDLMAAREAVLAARPGLWAGVNCPDIDAAGALRHFGPGVDGIWADDAMVDERAADQPAARRFAEARAEMGWGGLYFGGVAFKYQRRVEDAGSAARAAAGYVDVVTTSGAATGSALETSKIAAMKEAIGPVPLAIASGMTVQNVGEFLPHADVFLVATGISEDFDRLDPRRTAAMASAIVGWGGRR